MSGSWERSDNRWWRGPLALALALASSTCVRPDGSPRDPDDAVAEATLPVSAGDETESGDASGGWSAASSGADEPEEGGEALHSTDPAAPEPEPEPEPALALGKEPASSSGPPMSLGKVLGASERRIAAGVGRAGEPGEGGWVHFGPELAVRFEGGRAVEAAMTLPAGLRCVEAAVWAGFRRAMPPIRHPDRCAWPGLSERHRLARGVAGELSPATGVLHVWRIAGR